MPNFTIFMREEVFRALEALCDEEGVSRGKLLSMLVIEYGEKKGIRATREKVRPGIRK